MQQSVLYARYSTGPNVQIAAFRPWTCRATETLVPGIPESGLQKHTSCLNRIN